MISIQKNKDDGFASIRSIAAAVWPIAYGAILSKEQLAYMMEMMYSVAALQQQATENKHHFIVALDDETPVGFASFELNANETKKTKIHKIYVLSNMQGKGIGKQLINFIDREAEKHKQSALFLNVNKHNIAQHFYKKLGFTITQEEVIAIGNGYVMDDYVMEKSI